MAPILRRMKPKADAQTAQSASQALEFLAMSTSASAAPLAVVAQPPDPRAPQRVRHEPRRRTLTIRQVEKIAAHMIRITLTGDLEGFKSLGFDDHVKLFFPDGTINADGAPNMLGRDFTPRHYDPIKNTLAIDFAIH